MTPSVKSSHASRVIGRISAGVAAAGIVYAKHINYKPGSINRKVGGERVGER
jgi:hypothetical protein